MTLPMKVQFLDGCWFFYKSSRGIKPPSPSFFQKADVHLKTLLTADAAVAAKRAAAESVALCCAPCITRVTAASIDQEDRP